MKIQMIKEDLENSSHLPMNNPIEIAMSRFFCGRKYYVMGTHWFELEKDGKTQTGRKGRLEPTITVENFQTMYRSYPKNELEPIEFEVTAKCIGW